MFPVVTKGGGQAAGFPDVCKVPAPAPPGFVPSPFPNMARPSSASGTVAQVKICRKDTVVINSKIPSSNGDEAGVQKGMVMPQHRGECAFVRPSIKVKAKGKAVVLLTANTTHNGRNCPVGAVVAPSQTKVFAMG